MTCGIYTITSPVGRVYVGQSVDIERRFSEYMRNGSVKKQRRLAASFAKYGANNHEFLIVAECTESDSWEYVADGFSQGNISSCCSGRLKTHKGFKFAYEVAP